ncbi:MAG: ArsA-related P-loop ATPase [Pseudobdellovibrio sp.]
MIKLNPETKTLICIGTGGVGKTTLAASIGIGQALQGKKILVLTIDPSKRLAQALGLKADGELHQVNLKDFTSNNTPGGELWSCVIDHQKAFEKFIRQSSMNIASENDINRLLKNKLYLQLSGRLSGSQEFTSLITLYQYVQSGDYDLVILDTPPAQHTWSFLKAPEKIASLFNEGIANWFRSGTESTSLLKKIVTIGTTQVLKALEVLTGSEFIKELAAFFKAIQNWQQPLENYVMNCHRLLISPKTEFVLITGLDPSRLKEADKLSKEIRTQGYRLTSIVINRVPGWLSSTQTASNTDTTKNTLGQARLQDIVHYYESLETELKKSIHSFTSQQRVYKCFEFSQNTENVQQLKNNYDKIIEIH